MNQFVDGNLLEIEVRGKGEKEHDHDEAYMLGNFIFIWSKMKRKINKGNVYSK